MKLKKTSIEGLLLIEPKIWKDDRGYFFESFRKDIFEKEGLNIDFIQDNQSLSHKGTVRGLHFQNLPYEQGKLVRVIKGKVLDVVVDIRKNSPTYGQKYSIELSEENQLQLWIPPGFAHGFSTLEDHTIFCYKCTNYYHKASEGGLRWNDPSLNIDWKVSTPIVSEKDSSLPLFRDFNSMF
jgi:dTDP-4-dehydrorhamnose 3,5-epimerase